MTDFDKDEEDGFTSFAGIGILTSIMSLPLVGLIIYSITLIKL